MPQIVSRAVHEGLIAGMQQAKAAGENVTADQIISILTNVVMGKLNEVIIFDMEEDKTLALYEISSNLQRLVAKLDPEPVQNGSQPE